MKKPLITLYLVLLHAILGIVLWQSDFLTQVGLKSPPELGTHYHRMLTYHRSADPHLPSGATIFIGDSLTQALHTDAIANPSVNYGIGNDTTHGVLQRIPFYPSLNRAGTIVLAIGINDMRQRSNSEILDNYRKILAALPSSVPVLINAVLPVSEAAAAKWLNGPASRITDLNQQLAALAQTEKRLSFLNPGPILSDPEGFLKATYHRGDGVHLSQAGNQIWIGELRKQLSTID